ncbi:hypothetical protein [Fundicoccus culcitae]|uniref:Uncharacterized protein n=1 Tax=Fundicoccus culcitae TaxID=2969821 RepID=A0ABY5P428_9LACT|nr:hypothetical protein [Fundicoccus culcitae]UUX33439.1 hypothetical protein NRE15_11080 [Fundicoccus culcitae]
MPEVILRRRPAKLVGGRQLELSSGISDSRWIYGGLPAFALTSL